MGSCGCLGLVGCQCIKHKVSKAIAIILILALVFAPTIIAGRYASLWFWGAVGGLVIDAFAIAMLRGTD